MRKLKCAHKPSQQPSASPEVNRHIHSTCLHSQVLVVPSRMHVYMHVLKLAAIVWQMCATSFCTIKSVGQLNLKSKHFCRDRIQDASARHSSSKDIGTYSSFTQSHHSRKNACSPVRTVRMSLMQARAGELAEERLEGTLSHFTHPLCLSRSPKPIKRRPRPFDAPG